MEEAADILRVVPATLYRAIREDAFPALRLRSRYVIPATALHQLIEQAAESGGCVDPAAMAAQKRVARDVARHSGGEAR